MAKYNKRAKIEEKGGKRGKGKVESSEDEGSDE